MSKGLSYLEVVKELKTNDYLQDEVINISKSIAPWIPYIGLTLAGISIGKYAYSRYLRNKQTENGVDEVERGVKPTVPERDVNEPRSGQVEDPHRTVPDDNRREE